MPNYPCAGRCLPRGQLEGNQNQRIRRRREKTRLGARERELHPGPRRVPSTIPFSPFVFSNCTARPPGTACFFLRAATKPCGTGLGRADPGTGNATLGEGPNRLGLPRAAMLGRGGTLLCGAVPWRVEVLLPGQQSRMSPPPPRLLRLEHPLGWMEALGQRHKQPERGPRWAGSGFDTFL